MIDKEAVATQEVMQWVGDLGVKDTNKWAIDLGGLKGPISIWGLQPNRKLLPKPQQMLFAVPHSAALLQDYELEFDPDLHRTHPTYISENQNYISEQKKVMSKVHINFF